MLNFLLISEEAVPTEIKKFFSERHIKYQLTRGPLTLLNKLQNKNFNAVLWLNNPSFFSLFDDIIAVLNDFSIPLYIYGVTELSPALQEKIKIDFYQLPQIADLLEGDSLSHITAKADVAPATPKITSDHQPATVKNDSASLSEELNFRNLLRSKSKQRKLKLDVEKINAKYSTEGVTKDERLKLATSLPKNPDTKKNPSLLRKILKS